jgi:hypothetical protein
LAPYIKLGLCRTKKINEGRNSKNCPAIVYNKLVFSSLFNSFWNFKQKTAFLNIIFLPLKNGGVGSASVAL